MSSNIAQIDDSDNGLERLSWLRLMRTPRVGPATARRLVNMFGSAAIAVLNAPSLARNAGGVLRIPSLREAQIELERCHKFGAKMLILTDNAYPRAFQDLPDMPPIITVKGDPKLLNMRQIAIVGARHASAGGMSLATRFADELGRAGFVTTSGLAKGIDIAAHKGALKHGTIAVIAGGIDNVYPKEHLSWYERIGSEGLIISEQPFGCTPTAKLFPKRNRLIAALSQAVVVVEAAERSGTLITVRFALDYGREILAIPGSPLDSRSYGTNALIRQGATLVTCADDMLEVLLRNAINEPTITNSNSSTPTTTKIMHPIDSDGSRNRARQALLRHLSYTPCAFAELYELLDGDTQELAVLLIELELAGLIQRSADNKISLAPLSETGL
ncbi:MAG: DNA-protecting protein DprA [Proteobacteria bacterium]|nr:DNA-protecting protein DprA [Pseudomonadota bacterium]